jgi:hypothetical protein
LLFRRLGAFASHRSRRGWPAPWSKPCCQRYHHWLLAKGVPETLSQQFSFCLEPYLTFIYQYDAGNVQDVVPDAIEEFL